MNIKTVGIKKPKRDRKFSCAKCEYSGTSIKLLNEHYIDQHEPVQCEICDKEFNTPSSLKRHKYKHVDGKHVCTDCGEKFAFPSELKNHRASHIDDQGFKCMHGNCGKTFKVENELNKHVKKHSGVVWSCDCCTYLVSSFMVKLKSCSGRQRSLKLVVFCKYIYSNYAK